MLRVLVVAALAASACVIPPFEADCPADAGCGSCLDRSGCGWCAAPVAGACIPGTSLGPDDQSACPLTAWHFSSCEEAVCDDSCAAAGNGSCDEPERCDRGTDCTDCEG